MFYRLRTSTAIALLGLLPTAATADGEADFIRQCAACHGIASAGIASTGRKAAGDLGGAADRGGANWLRPYIGTNSSTRLHRVKFKGSDEELQALVDWLLEHPAQ